MTPLTQLADREEEWITWAGGECPVDPDTLVEIECRCGEQNGAWRAGMWSDGVSDWWKHDGKGHFGHRNDIIAYRVMQP